MRTLVVEDYLQNLVLAKISYPAPRHEIVEAVNPVTALEILRHDPHFDLILFELFFDTASRRLFTEIRNSWPHIPVAILTSETDGQWENLLQAHGGLCVFHKPITLMAAICHARKALARQTDRWRLKAYRHRRRVEQERLSLRHRELLV
jgi:CheY-like chemotaxis protein